MKLADMSEEELRKEIYGIRRELRSDIKAVRDLQKVSTAIPTYATNQMKNIEKTMRTKSVKNMDKSELVTTLRDLKYIRGLKSSSVEGAKKTAKSFEPLKDKLESLSENMRDKFWEIYGKAYGQLKGNLESFKYEIFESDLIDVITSNTDTSELALKIEQIYRDIQEKYTKDTSENVKKRAFSRKLSNYLK